MTEHATGTRAAQAIRLGLPLDSNSTDQAERILRKLDAAGFDVVPRDAIPNREAECSECNGTGLGCCDHCGGTGHATRNRVASSFRLDKEGWMECLVCGATFRPAPGMEWEHTCYA